MNRVETTSTGRSRVLGLLLVVGIATSSGTALAEAEFDFASPSAHPGFTYLKSNGSLTVQVCATKKWLGNYVSDGALWPSPPYKINLVWKAYKKWNWAAPATLPTSTLLVLSINGTKYCSEAMTVKYKDFPVQDQWRVTATVQLDKGVQSPHAERLISVLPPTLSASPQGNLKAAPIIVPKAGRTEDSQRSDTPQR